MQLLRPPHGGMHTLRTLRTELRGSTPHLTNDALRTSRLLPVAHPGTHVGRCILALHQRTPSDIPHLRTVDRNGRNVGHRRSGMGSDHRHSLRRLGIGDGRPDRPSRRSHHGHTAYRARALLRILLSIRNTPNGADVGNLRAGARGRVHRRGGASGDRASVVEVGVHVREQESVFEGRRAAFERLYRVAADAAGQIEFGIVRVYEASVWDFGLPALLAKERGYRLRVWMDELEGPF
mmetsp:Transcript_21365/g.44596  ORF Transcript_21365/g.44596 Transcript_21365/m.44596 type:complete len:236 (+) Transcript_21365:1117-1824(+)